MRNQYRHSIPFLAFMLVIALSMACSDGPFFELKKMNPIFRKQWKQDRQLGPTFSDRQAEMRKLQSQFARMDAAEQAKWVKTIEKILAEEPSADMRRDAVLTLKSYKGPELTQILAKVSQDESEKVRMAACTTLGLQTDNASLAVLSKLATEDESPSVKIAAIESIGGYKSEEAKRILSQTIDNPSPAIQFKTAESLAKVTGKNFGGDVPAWKQFLAGEDVEEPKVSLAQQWTGWLGFRR